MHVTYNLIHKNLFTGIWTLLSKHRLPLCLPNNTWVIYYLFIVGRDSSVGIATRYGLDGPEIGSRWGGGEILRTRPDRPWGSPSLLYNWFRVSFPRVKRSGHDAEHPRPFSAEIKERVELYLYSPSGPSWPVLGWTLRLLYIYLFFIIINYLLRISVICSIGTDTVNMWLHKFCFLSLYYM